ncbi:CC0125/CC1285 family lipoprotein [Parvularcula maris]|uniref:DUF4136 domain-containing protein n=1 Tax=Parvularcula maris TaxID=2965077 RepID=A0A9X2L6E9_9PROT|nr:hypothetical protein [Parvularcula maris]MCQ8183806.1 hypothetical protein [Parvularcula maris]
MRIFLAAVLTAGLAACATPTPFEPADGQGYGFADQKIEDNRYRISFRGNSLTTREQVETALLLRAAEITLENGYDHFFVVSDETETERRTRVTDLGPRYGAFGYYGFGPFPYYARGFGPGFFGPGFNDVDIRETQRYTAIAFVVLGRGPKPEGDLTAYDARDVQKNLSGAVVRREK